MARTLRRALLGAIICGTLLTVTGTAASAADPAGVVHFVKHTDSSFDRFTNRPTPAFQEWMRAKFWRSVVWSPYFDNRNSWYQHGWTYKNVYALYVGSDYARQHDDWVLRDAQGRRLYIPFGCSGGTCPQYAADITSPAFRQAWIQNAADELRTGYKGLYLDDVNLEFRVGDGNGKEVAPIDRNTGQPMTAKAWRGYMAAFMEEIRRAFPSTEIVHNSIWFAVSGARDSDPDVKRQIAAADYINVERGVNDSGLTGGTGSWSLQALFSYIDRVHAAGKGVLIDGGEDAAAEREYSLASYFLISSGNDGIGLIQMTPENWWSGFDIDLGAAKGTRTGWQGLIRRDFDGGIVLVNEPNAPTRTVTLPAPMLTTDGTQVTAVALAAKRGAVLRYATDQRGGTPPGEDVPPGDELPGGNDGASEPQQPEQPREPVRPVGIEQPSEPEPPAEPEQPVPEQPGRPQQPSEPEPAAEPQPPAASVSRPTRPTMRRPSKPASRRPSRDRRRGSKVRVTTQRNGRTVLVRGTVRAARGVRVRVRVQQRSRTGWVDVHAVRAAVSSSGRFRTTVRNLRPGAYRVRAAYVSTGSARASSAALGSFRIGR